MEASSRRKSSPSNGSKPRAPVHASVAASERGARARGLDGTPERRATGLRARLEELELAGAEQMATLTHDLRNPLSVILVTVRMLGRALGADHPSQRHVEAVARAADEMNLMLQDLSDASSIERHRLALSCETQDVAPLVAHAIGAVEGAARAKGIKIGQEIDASVPAARVEADRLAKVVQHLLMNAIRFTPRGGRVTVHLHRSPEGGVALSVADTGPGVPDDVRPLAFHRAAKGKRPPAQGIGLGLYVAKGIVEAHGGEVWFESQSGKGSRFGFRLPPADGPS